MGARNIPLTSRRHFGNVGGLSTTGFYNMRMRLNFMRGVTLTLVLMLAACAGRGEIDPEDTSGAVVLMGLEMDGRRVTQLGYYYVFNFVDEHEQTTQVVKRPRHTHNQLVFDELGPGSWTLVSFAARSVPGLDGFADISVRQRPVLLDFEVEEGAVHILSHQLTIEHGRGLYDLIETSPRITPLTDNVRARVERRADRMGPDWTYLLEPRGTLQERDEDRRGFLERLFGN